MTMEGHVQFLLGSFKDFFGIEKYKTELGKDFKRITLFLRTSNDLELSEQNPSNDNLDEDEAAIMWEEAEGSVDYGQSMQNISAEEMQQTEGDRKPAQKIQDE